MRVRMNFSTFHSVSHFSGHSNSSISVVNVPCVRTYDAIGKEILYVQGINFRSFTDKYVGISCRASVVPQTDEQLPPGFRCSSDR